MFEFFNKLKELEFSFIFNEKAIENSWIKQSYNWFLYYLITTWIFIFSKYYVRYNMRMGLIKLQYADWLVLNIMKDIHLVLFLLFVVNFFFVIIQFHINETKKNWFDFNQNIKTLDEIPNDVKQTWIYKYIYIYLSNFNIFLLFFCLVESDHIFVQVCLPFWDGIFMLVISISIHLIFWLNYFFNYSKRKNK